MSLAILLKPPDGPNKNIIRSFPKSWVLSRFLQNKFCSTMSCCKVNNVSSTN